MAKKIALNKKAKAKPELPKGLARALAERKASADSETLLTDLIEVWGGTRRLALDIHADFIRAAAGSMTRQRILEMLINLSTSYLLRHACYGSPGKVDRRICERSMGWKVG